MLINRTKASITTIAGVTLFPGNNTVEGDVVETLREHKDFKAQVEAGYMKEVEPKKVEVPAESAASESDETTDDITEMSGKDAVEVIEGTFHVKHLEKMLEAEKGSKDRKGVKKAIEAQMSEMRKEDGEGEE